MSAQYIVSARKYRPQTFETVIGQEHITTTLKNAIRNQHLAHAFLFCGPRGVGKTTCARILAKTINCEQRTDDIEACGTCTTCRSFEDNKSFNIFELDAASNNSVEDIRELVSQVRFAPQQGKYKIYIIDEVHMLTTAAFNAFLKTLEEPPPYAKFILATTEKHKILPTILSRCQIFDFKRITTEHIVAHLQSIATREHMVAQEAALHVVAQKSEGCMRDALSMLDRIAGFTEGNITYNATMEHLNMLDADYYFRITDIILSQDVAGTLLALDEVLDKGFEGNVIIEGMEEHIRNLLLCKDQRMSKLLDVPETHKPIYFEKANQMPASFALSALNVLNDAELNFKNSNNKRLHLEMCFIRLCYLLQATQVNTSSQIEEKKKPEISQPITANTIAAIPAIKTNDVAQKILPTTEQHQLENVVEEPVVMEPPVANINTPTEKQPSTIRRISKDLLQELDTIINEEVDAKQAAQALTEATMYQVFERYLQHLLNEKRTLFYTQFSKMKLELIDGQEVHFITTDEMADSCVKEQRNFLLDYFKKETNVLVRITSEIKEDPNEILAGKESIMSKQEKYDAMVLKNPQLAELRSKLNLQIDF